MRRSIRLAVMAIVATVGGVAFWACSNNIPTTTTTTPTITTDTFNGTLNPNGAQTFSFSVQAAAVLTATLTSISPDSTATLGLAIGTWNGSACQIVIANDKAVQGTVVTGSSGGAGTLCVRVYDVGNLTQNEAFVVTVVHP